MPNIHMRSIRERIDGSFDDTELKGICFDHFPKVYNKFTSGMTKQQMVQLLLDHCRLYQIGSVLLDVVERERPGLIGLDRESLLTQLNASGLYLVDEKAEKRSIVVANARDFLITQLYHHPKLLFAVLLLAILAACILLVIGISLLRASIGFLQS